MTLRDPSRPTLSPRYDTVHAQGHAQGGARDQAPAYAMPIAELRRLVASMVD